MNSNGITLSCIFCNPDQGVQQFAPETLEGAMSNSTSKKNMEKETGLSMWPQAVGEVAKMAPVLLNVSLFEVIASAWNKYRLLSEFSDPDRYSPGEMFLIPLAEHTINSEHRPHIDILVGEHQIGRIDFLIDISLILNGFVAKVQGGRLREIKVGNCKAKSSITCEGFILAEKESASLDLPGSIDLGEGIPISFGNGTINKV